jgi:hypothetical protein
MKASEEKPKIEKNSKFLEKVHEVDITFLLIRSSRSLPVVVDHVSNRARGLGQEIRVVVDVLDTVYSRHEKLTYPYI